MTRAPKIAAQKKQLISILRDKKYPYQTALTLITKPTLLKMKLEGYPMECNGYPYPCGITNAW